MQIMIANCFNGGAIILVYDCKDLSSSYKQAYAGNQFILNRPRSPAE